jgi:hypothetical protein
VLPRRLQDVRADDVTITYKTCIPTATVPRYSAAPRDRPLAGAVGRSYNPTVWNYAADCTPCGRTNKTCTAGGAHTIIGI